MQLDVDYDTEELEEPEFSHFVSSSTNSRHTSFSMRPEVPPLTPLPCTPPRIESPHLQIDMSPIPAVNIMDPQLSDTLEVQCLTNSPANSTVHELTGNISDQADDPPRPDVDEQQNLSQDHIQNSRSNDDLLSQNDTVDLDTVAQPASPAGNQLSREQLKNLRRDSNIIAVSKMTRPPSTKDRDDILDLILGWWWPVEDDEYDHPYAQHVVRVLDQLPPEEGKLSGCETDKKPKTPAEFFDHLFDESLWDDLREGTNQYVAANRSHLLAEPESRYKNWTDCSNAELKAVFALLIGMGNVRKRDMPSYWNTAQTDKVARTPFFSSVMPRNRFLAIYWALHLPHDHEDDHPLRKVKILLDKCNTRFRAAYVPGKRLSYDECSCAFRGRVHFLHYNPSKPDKYHIMVYACSENSGYTIGLDPYYGETQRDQYKHLKNAGQENHTQLNVGAIIRSALQRQQQVFDTARDQDILQSYLFRTSKSMRNGKEVRRRKKRAEETDEHNGDTDEEDEADTTSIPTTSLRDEASVRIACKNYINACQRRLADKERGVNDRQVFGHLESLQLLDKGYFIFMDNMYTSPSLFAELLKRKTFACGTVRNQKVGFPEALQNITPPVSKALQLDMPERGDVKARRKPVPGTDGSMLAINFMDKKQVLMLTTIHSAKMVTLKLRESKQRWKDAQAEKARQFEDGQKRKQEIMRIPARRRTPEQKEELENIKKLQKPTQPVTDQKPFAVYDYNFDMGGPDLLGQLVDSYDFLRATVSWPKKFMLWMFSCLLVNAYILHSKFGTQSSMNHYVFRLAVIDHLLKDTDQERRMQKSNDHALSCERVTPGAHFPEALPKEEDKRRPQSQCFACNFTIPQMKRYLSEEEFRHCVELKRIRTSFRCKSCLVPLCIEPCFEIYHTERDFRKTCLDFRLQT